MAEPDDGIRIPVEPPQARFSLKAWDESASGLPLTEKNVLHQRAHNAGRSPFMGGSGSVLRKAPPS